MNLWSHLHQGESSIVLNLVFCFFGSCLFRGPIHVFLLIYFSVAELEKLYSFAVLGSEAEKLAASKILCGASLLRGWNIQVL
jgi:hypothetical protein